MTHSFSRIPNTNIKRSVFAGPKRYMTTFNADMIVPFYAEEVLPADTFHVTSKIFARMASLKKPIMENVKMDTFYFYVPNRLLWDNWPKFIGDQDDPMSPTEYEVPHIHAGATGWSSLSLEDYFGAAIAVNQEWMISLYHRAYYMIYNEWFRDENLIDKLFECKGDTDVDDGPNGGAPVVYTLQRRGKRHDYFTSCLPWPQKGEAVQIPVGGEAPVFGTGKALALAGINETTNDYGTFGLYSYSNTVLAANDASFGDSIGNSRNFMVGPDESRSLGIPTKGSLTSNFANSGMYADLSEATAFDVNTLRTAMQLQIMLEKDARGGTRYTEIMRVHYGVTTPDGRIQRPEYLGGSNSTMSIYPIAQTSSTVEGSPQANLSGMALVTNQSGFSKSFTEFGVVLGLMSVSADLTYQQGTDRKFKRKLKHDYAWPTLAHLGEQAVLNGEIYAQGPTVLNQVTGVPYDEEVFGYQERYAEYRYFRNQITGDLRSNGTVPTGTTPPLDLWHLSQDFTSLPSLNQSFIECHTPMDRVLAVPGTPGSPIPDFICDIWMDLKYVRPLPTFGVPGLMDHF